MTSAPFSIAEAMQRVADARIENFVELIKLAGLDPRRHLRFSQWSGIDFNGCNLKGYDFSGACLRDCNFKGARIADARFDKADIRGSNLRDATDWKAHSESWKRAPKRLGDDHLRVGAMFQDAPFAPEMAVIPPGGFIMGSPVEELRVATLSAIRNHEKNEGPRHEVTIPLPLPGCYDNEGPNEVPRHEVTIPHPFAVGRYPVTFEEWDFAQDDNDWGSVTGIKPRQPDDEKWGRGRRPVIHISWNDAKAYVTWLVHRTGQPYRLLSEAEWEYACRAGTSTPFWWGSSITPDQANYNSNYTYEAGGSTVECRGKTLPVESFEPNPWGLHQVHGNVCEWCEDVWHNNYEDKPDELKSNGGAWTTGDGYLRVFRGGSWNDDPQDLRSAYRYRLFADDRGYVSFGFRVARTLNL